MAVSVARYPVSRRTVVSVPRIELYHRGFAIHVTKAQDGSDRFSFRIDSRGLDLHTSASEYLSAHGAERAARVFIDDALGGFDYATRALDAS